MIHIRVYTPSLFLKVNEVKIGLTTDKMAGPRGNAGPACVLGTDKLAEKNILPCRKMFVSLHRLSRWTGSLDNYLKGFGRWVHASVWSGTRELRPLLLLSIINQTLIVMIFDEVTELYESTSKVDESTKASMLWVAPAEGGLEGCILGDTTELMKMYKAIFMGVLPLARERGWIK